MTTSDRARDPSLARGGLRGHRPAGRRAGGGPRLDLPARRPPPRRRLAGGATNLRARARSLVRPSRVGRLGDAGAPPRSTRQPRRARGVPATTTSTGPAATPQRRRAPSWTHTRSARATATAARTVIAAATAASASAGRPREHHPCQHDAAAWNAGAVARPIAAPPRRPSRNPPPRGASAPPTRRIEAAVEAVERAVRREQESPASASSRRRTHPSREEDDRPADAGRRRAPPPAPRLERPEGRVARRALDDDRQHGGAPAVPAPRGGRPRGRRSPPRLAGVTPPSACAA